ncbi:MAG: TerD family protein [Prevotella fusca]|uniref:TerD family protein n=1 Tax=Prevotella fusca TaxID=589436 RepID=UPI003FA0F0F1
MINLVKGQNAQLDLNKFHVGLGWDVREDRTSSYDFDLDVSAFPILTATGCIIGDLITNKIQKIKQ